MRFVDDIFDETMQAIKDAGQWDNTIVLLTGKLLLRLRYFINLVFQLLIWIWISSILTISADNGGAIFPLNANNNYPLRGGKRSIFEGGYRVIQFLSGGWINKSPHHQKQSQDLMLGRKSDTFIFVQDWAPTFLEMVGGSDAVDHLYKKIVYDGKFVSKSICFAFMCIHISNGVSYMLYTALQLRPFLDRYPCRPDGRQPYVEISTKLPGFKCTMGRETKTATEESVLQLKAVLWCAARWNLQAHAHSSCAAQFLHPEVGTYLARRWWSHSRLWIHLYHAMPPWGRRQASGVLPL